MVLHFSASKDGSTNLQHISVRAQLTGTKNGWWSVQDDDSRIWKMFFQEWSGPSGVHPNGTFHLFSLKNGKRISNVILWNGPWHDFDSKHTWGQGRIYQPSNIAWVNYKLGWSVL